MLTVICLFDTEVRLDRDSKSLIPLNWNNCIRRRKMVNLRTITQQPLHLDGKLFLHASFGAVYVRVWLGIVTNLAINMLLGTLIVGRFIYAFVPFGYGIAALALSFGSYFGTSRNSKSSKPTTAVVIMSIGDTHKSCIEFEKMPNSVRMARQALLQPHNECGVMGSTSEFGIHTIEIRILNENRPSTFSIHIVIDVVPTQLHRILFSNFSLKAKHQPKHMVEAYTTGPSDIRHDCCIHSQSEIPNGNSRESGSFCV